ncbi:MAG: hypothetical protein OXO49_02050 [Gammaproteobacteria bacterium]|nr:hypothetical protein [Gammaproteobacteria bacterium]MDE0251287.1 hypothetical protein [Gammaproteobacteria bacterium]MDE0402028.1 hypothetical protein [Gammaproteobacteria bacterium]
MKLSKQKLPFIFNLIRFNESHQQDISGQNFYFERVAKGKRRMWATHIDIEDPTPAKVIIFVRTDVKRQEIVDEINKAQTFFREQVEPAHSE